jgi:hypothetical protein
VEVRNGVAMVLVMTCIPMDLMEQAFGWVRTYKDKSYSKQLLDIM